jgi:hypothetical protein
MRRIKKPIEDSQDVKDEAFLRQYSPRPSSAAISLDQVREELAAALETARAGTKAVDREARTFALGRVSALEEAIRLMDKALQDQASAQIKAAATGKAQQ